MKIQYDIVGWFLCRTERTEQTVVHSNGKLVCGAEYIDENCVFGRLSKGAMQCTEETFIRSYRGAEDDIRTWTLIGRWVGLSSSTDADADIDASSHDGGHVDRYVGTVCKYCTTFRFIRSHGACQADVYYDRLPSHCTSISVSFRHVVNKKTAWI